MCREHFESINKVKSSSRFFNARLMSAEEQCGLTEDVYLLKPGNGTDKSVEIALTHISSTRSNAKSETIVFVHGNYQNRRLWLSPSGDCLARAMAREGYCVWLVEFPGHGLAPSNIEFENNNLSGYGRLLVPALSTFIAEHSAINYHWIGYGTGVGAILYAAALGEISDDEIATITGLGVPYYQPKWSKLPGAANTLAARRLQTNLEVGPEQEALGFIQELLQENRWFAHRGAALGIDLWTELLSRQVPLHWFGNDYSLDFYDAGFSRLRSAGLLYSLTCDDFGVDDYTAENIATTLGSNTGIQQHTKVLLERVLNRNRCTDGLLPIRETAPAV